MRKRELERRLADAKAQERETKARLESMRERVEGMRDNLGGLALDRAELVSALVSLDRQVRCVLEEPEEFLDIELLELARIREQLYEDDTVVKRVLVDHDAVRRMSP